MSKKPLFTGSGVALVTPMKEDGSINYPELARILDDQIQGGTDAIFVCCTTGEAPTLDDPEHLECIRYTVDHVAGRVPVIAGTGSNNTAHAIMMTKEAQEMGADGVLLVTPYYNKTSQKGLVEHFTVIAQSTTLPCIVYNVPSRTGVNITPETALALSKIPNIVGIKEASGNISQVAKIARLCGDDLYIYSGNDDQIVPVLSLGGKGVVSVLANVAPQVTHEICDLWFKGETQKSLDLQLKYLDLCNALFMDVNPIPAKQAMKELGYDVGFCRLPLCDMDDDKKKTLRNVMEAAGLL